VLREQQDFFEDELPFVRQVVQPGQKANHRTCDSGVWRLARIAHDFASALWWSTR